MNLLALDLAQRTGWAVWRDGYLMSGVATFGGPIGQQLSNFRSWLWDVPLDHSMRIVFEAPVLRGGKTKKTSRITAERLMGMTGMCQAVAYEAHCPVRECSSSAFLKHFTGQGGGKRDERKARVMDACRSRGLNPVDDNEADALALLDYAAHCFDIRTSIPAGPLLKGAA